MQNLIELLYSVTYQLQAVILSEAKNPGIDSQMFRLSAQHDKLLYKVLQSNRFGKKTFHQLNP